MPGLRFSHDAKLLSRDALLDADFGVGPVRSLFAPILLAQRGKEAGIRRPDPSVPALCPANRVPLRGSDARKDGLKYQDREEDHGGGGCPQ